MHKFIATVVCFYSHARMWSSVLGGLTLILMGPTRTVVDAAPVCYQSTLAPASSLGYTAFVRMLRHAVEDSPYIQLVLQDLGSLSPFTLVPPVLATHGREHLGRNKSIHLLPFSLSEKGGLFFRELFGLEPAHVNTFLACITVEKMGMAIPYALILEDPSKNRICHLQLLALGCEMPNALVRKVDFPSVGATIDRIPYKDLYRDLSVALERFRPGYRVEGAIFRLPLKTETAWHGHEGLETRYKVRVIYLTQPPLEAPRPPELPAEFRGPGFRRMMFWADDTRYDTDILMNPHDPYHQNFASALQEFGPRFTEKNVGVIGTGQGADY